MKTGVTSVLTAWASRRLDLIVHIGAGHGGELEAYAAMAPERVVLVEGDPDTAAMLREASEPYAWAQVVEAVVAAAAGPTAWHRYNVPGLNGTVDASVMRDVYPGLRALDTQLRPAQALGVLVDTLLPRASASCAVLVIDVFDADMRLLADVGPERLRRFDAVVVRRCVRGSESGASLGVRAMLEESGFAQDQVATTEPSEAMWPVQLWSLDRAAFEIRIMAARLAQAEGELRRLEGAAVDSERRLAWFNGERDELAAQCQRLELSAARTARQADDLRVGLTAERSRAVAAEVELSARTAALDAERQARARDVAAHEAALALAADRVLAMEARATTAEAEVETARAQGQARVAALESDLEARLAQAQARNVAMAAAHEDALAQARATVAALEADRATARAEAAALSEQASAAAGRLEEVERLLSEQRARGDDLAQQHRVNDEQLSELRPRLAALESAHETATSELSRLAAELAREREAAQTEAGRMRGQASQAATERDKLVALAEARLAKIDGLSAAYAQLEERRATAANRLGEVERALAEQVAGNDALKAQVQQGQTQLAAAQAAHQFAVSQLEQQRAETRRIADAKDELFVRATESQGKAAQLAVEREKLVALAEARLAKADTLAAALAAAERSAAELRQALDKRTAAAASLDKSLAEATSDKQRLHQESARHATVGQELKKEVEQLAAARTTLAAEVESLRRGVAAHEGVRAELERLAQDRQVKLGLQIQRVTHLEREAEAAGLRERLLRDELIQAEAQIDLIKDVLLREQAL